MERCITTCKVLNLNRHIYVDRSVLELGAGGGFPSIVTAKNGARKVRHWLNRSSQYYICVCHHIGYSYGLSRRQSYGKPGPQSCCKYRSGRKEKVDVQARFSKLSLLIYIIGDTSGSSPFIGTLRSFWSFYGIGVSWRPDCSSDGRNFLYSPTWLLSWHPMEICRPLTRKILTKTGPCLHWGKPSFFPILSFSPFSYIGLAAPTVYAEAEVNIIFAVGSVSTAPPKTSETPDPNPVWKKRRTENLLLYHLQQVRCGSISITTGRHLPFFPFVKPESALNSVVFSTWSSNGGILSASFFALV